VVGCVTERSRPPNGGLNIGGTPSATADGRCVPGSSQDASQEPGTQRPGACHIGLRLNPLLQSSICVLAQSRACCARARAALAAASFAARSALSPVQHPLRQPRDPHSSHSFVSPTAQAFACSSSIRGILAECPCNACVATLEDRPAHRPMPINAAGVSKFRRRFGSALVLPSEAIPADQCAGRRGPQLPAT